MARCAVYPLASIPKTLFEMPEVGHFIESSKGQHWLENLAIKAAYHPNSARVLEMVNKFGLTANLTDALDYRTALLKNLYNPEAKAITSARNTLFSQIW